RLGDPQRGAQPPGAVIEPGAEIRRGDWDVSVQVANDPFQTNGRPVMEADRRKGAVAHRQRKHTGLLEARGPQRQMNLIAIRPQVEEIAATLAQGLGGRGPGW